MDLGKKDNFAGAFMIVLNGITKKLPLIIVTFTILWGVWTAYGSEKLNDRIDERIDKKNAPIIDVVDSTFLKVIENGEMMASLLRDMGKEELIEQAKAVVRKKKMIDSTRKKLGKTKYEIKRVK